MQETILSLQDVSYSYQTKAQTVHAVREVRYSFETGRFYAIMGRSGSGKTTLLSLMAGLELPDSGQVCYRETPTSQLDCDAYRRDKAAVIYQSYNLFPLLTAEENAAYPLRLRGEGTGKAIAAARSKLSSVGLTEGQFRRFPSQLSGGEQQRVAIARALAKNPKLLLCDEPTGALDYATGKEVLKLLQDQSREQGMTVVIITHNSALTAMADRVIKVRSGTIQSVKENEHVIPVEEIEW